MAINCGGYGCLDFANCDECKVRGSIIYYKELLECGYKKTIEFNSDNKLSRFEYLSNYIFNFTTYDSSISVKFAKMALEVCSAINNRTTFEYIESQKKYETFLLMCNMPFFLERIEWGTSIRGAWWQPKHGTRFTLDGCGLWDKEKQITNLQLSKEEWENFISEILSFSLKKNKL